MPSKSQAQHRLMAARAHGWKPKGGWKEKPPPMDVAKEFVAADKKSKGWKKKERA